ncbi:MAG: hypothetical protein ACI9JN_002699 [Bacteroidia bacterium]|jgi:hypothetical protein
MKTLRMALCLTILLFSCQGPRKQVKQDFVPAIYIQRNMQFNAASSSQDGEMFSVGYLNEVDGPPQNIMLNSVSLNADNQYSLQTSTYDGNLSNDIYGQNVLIKWDDEILFPAFYCPERYNVFYNDLVHPGSIAPGMSFTWKTDLKSQHVTVTLFASKASVPSLVAPINHTKTMQDKGRFRLPKHWLDDIPKNAYIRFTMDRYNTSVATTNSNHRVRVEAHSSSSGSFRVE